MSSNGTFVRLPDQFAGLQPFVERWAVAGLANRDAARTARPNDECRAFYAAVKDQIFPILDYLDAKPMADLDRADAALLNMALAYIHISLAIEMQGDVEPFHAGMRQHMHITHEPREPWNGTGRETQRHSD